MTIERQYQGDLAAILAKRYDNGWDFWTTTDKRLAKGTPFSALDSTLLLLELGLDPSDALLQDMAELIFSSWREDGRFKLYPNGAIYPCQTIHAANVLCHLGCATDARLQKTFRHLLEIQEDDGGWRCKKFSFGRGPETEFSNPGPTLTALNAFRFTDYLDQEPALDQAVEFLLAHWRTRKPLGPCHYGIGTLFMQPEYPFGNYNLFIYLYVLSFYSRAKHDDRFLEALALFESKLADGKVVAARVNPKLAGFTFCKKGEPSELATKRYRQILMNLGRNNTAGW
ncbi:MAG TPA: prenyltransferase [Syntrophomonas sp.]|nr:prenyltransferase [Syntrophomonas sp.]